MKLFPSPKFQTFTIANFLLESGIILPEIHLAYKISGTPSVKAPILTCTSFAQTYYDLAYLKGPKLALDPKQDWIVHTELLGNGRSTSPSNTPPPFNGANFPTITIRDNVALQYALLQYLGVKEISAVVGASLGGQQAIQWAVSYPDIVQKVVAIVGNCRTTWHVRLFLNSLINCIRSDPAFNEGNYTQPPLTGLSRMAETWIPWMFSPEFFSCQEYNKYMDMRADSLEEFFAKSRTRYHEYDANDLLCQFQIWFNHDVSLNPGMEDSLGKALARIKARVLFIPNRTDAYFAAVDVVADAAMISNAEIIMLDSIYGHAAGFGRAKADRDRINNAIAKFVVGLKPS